MSFLRYVLRRLAQAGLVLALVLQLLGIAHPAALFLPVALAILGNGITLPNAQAGALNAVSADMSAAQGASATAVPAAAAEAEGAACYLRPGDPGFEECEACQ